MATKHKSKKKKAQAYDSIDSERVAKLMTLMDAPRNRQSRRTFPLLVQIKGCIPASVPGKPPFPCPL